MKVICDLTDDYTSWSCSDLHWGGWQYLWISLKGYSGVNLIHGLTHCDRPPRQIKFSASVCSFTNLRKDCTITIHCSLCLHQETAIKKSLIATKHQTSATVQIFFLRQRIIFIIVIIILFIYLFFSKIWARAKRFCIATRMRTTV